MASVRIDSGPPAAWMRPREVQRDDWFRLMQEKRSFIQTNIPYDCRCLLEFVQDANEMWEELGFKSTQDMINNGYELDPAEVDLAYEWLSIQNPETAVNFKTAVKGGRKLRDRPGTPEGTVNNPLGIGGKSGKKVEIDNVGNSNINIAPKEKIVGNTNEYFLARIERDTPEILEKYKQGEFPSVRQAAIAAGIVKVPTPYEVAVKAITKLSQKELLKIRDHVKTILSQDT